MSLIHVFYINRDVLYTISLILGTCFQLFQWTREKQISSIKESNRDSKMRWLLTSWVDDSKGIYCVHVRILWRISHRDSVQDWRNAKKKSLQFLDFLCPDRIAAKNMPVKNQCSCSVYYSSFSVKCKSFFFRTESFAFHYLTLLFRHRNHSSRSTHLCNSKY